MSQYDSPVSPFPDPNAPKVGTLVNAKLPDSAGGLIQSTKEAIIVALREAMTASTLSIGNGDTTLEIDMEYPMELVNYPGIWVQFSISKLNRVGISHEVMTKTIENEGTPEEWINWEPVQEWGFEGRVSLTVVAMTSLERDRISDTLLTVLAFARPPSLVLTDPKRDTKQFKSLITELAKNPYIFMAINTDEIVAGGQSMAQAPFDPENFLTYEDTYSFDVMGQFAIKFKHDGTYTLTKIDEVPTMASTLPNHTWNPYEWH